ncbi:ParB/RepB/Spo0J family partition protein [Thiocystis violacea]|uniref:ParB/RepB/Spo0J family partition protein n=1 Tax=Thiocystis violacea TaxID=13725 RepID=UPI00190779C1|nr:ParB/RepB/Spo0J family partition protein [Thiocystis violacea]MBK1718083.1 hypothetical protein [Thiocystis violacea]
MSSSLGLEKLAGLRGLSSLVSPPAGIAGEPVDLSLDLIDENPDQPRVTFEDMDDLAASIRSGGVKVPILVHPRTDVPGRYMLDDGARRYRGSRMAGKTTIPAVVIEPLSVIDQIVVNKDRADTPAKDKARAFQRLLKENGWTQRQLAEQFGMRQEEPGKPARPRVSEAYISQHLSLLSLPEPLDDLFESGRCQDVTLITELAKAYRKDTAAVQEWINDPDQDLSRRSVKLLREFIDDRKDRREERSEQPVTEDVDEQASYEESGSEFDREARFGGDEQANEVPDVSSPYPKTSNNPTEPSKTRDPNQPKIGRTAKVARLSVFVTYGERLATLNLGKAPTNQGFVWLSFEDKKEEECAICDIQLREVREA